jgi:hypothetical protein
MTTEHRTHARRWLLVGLLIIATSVSLVVGLFIASGEQEDGPVVSAGRTRTIESSAAVVPAAPASSPPSVDVDIAGEAVRGPAATAVGEGQEPLGTTEECRSDPGCPSSEHRTGDPCGAAIIVDTAGYLEGRHDAEGGMPYQIDEAPAPGPSDDDDDDATVGPETLYRAGYVQGWCDGGGVPASSP